MHDEFKSQVFTLGIIFLQAALLESNEDIYDLKEYKIRENIL